MKIVCFGELLLRYCPDPSGDWANLNSVPVFVGGAELNAAHALAFWKQPVSFCTAIPQNYMTQHIVENLEKKGIDISPIIFSGNRVGAYYLPLGSELKNAGVIYDRAYSSYADLKTGDINWDKVLDGATWFHLSAICPALNRSVADVCVEVVKVAKQKGITVSMDLNFRKALWQYGEAADKIMSKIMPYCDVVMGNIWAIESLCGIKNPLANPNETDDNLLKEGGKQACLALQKKFNNIQTVALTFRMAEHYWGLLCRQNQFVSSKKFSPLVLKDRVGSGDCFMAGLIYGLSNKHESEQIINFAAAAAVGKLAEEGDSTKQSVEQIFKRIDEQA